MPIKPYVGITGVTERNQSEALVEILEEIGWPESHHLMVGVLVSYKGLVWGRLANPNQYLPIDQIDSVLLGDTRLLNLIHYNSRAAGLFAQLSDVVKAVSYADGLQLNIAWPRPDQLNRLRERIYTRVVLQLGRSAYAMIGRRPQRLIERLRPYSGLIEAVLVDPSGGIGRSFDLGFALATLEALVGSGLPMNWGIAGGLGPDNVARLQPLLRLYPDLSWDAQSSLRDGGDRLDLGRCRSYLEAAAELIRTASG